VGRLGKLEAIFALLNFMQSGLNDRLNSGLVLLAATMDYQDAACAVLVAAIQLTHSHCLGQAVVVHDCKFWPEWGNCAY
jgi:hypothetical protein